MVIQSMKMAIKAILGNKMRTFLTMLGIIIGVFALVVLVSLVNSATNSVTSEINSMGKDMFTVSVMDDKGKPLKESDMNQIRSNELVSMVSPVIQINGTAKNGRNSVTITASGAGNNYFTIQSQKLLYGRLIQQPDLDNASYVTVLSYDTAVKLFGGTDVVGTEMQLNGTNFKVVGVLAKDTSMTSAMRSGYNMYIPFSVAQRISPSGGGISMFYVTAKNSQSINAVQKYLNHFMLSRFNNDENAYDVFNYDNLSQTMQSVTGTFSALLGGIAAISLLVGGIGIMNIMLVSVTERTREIGIRKAIGARRSSILLQFLIEALVICLIGCVIGIVLSMGVLALANLLVTSMTFTVSIGIILIAIVFSTAMGLLFGVYPARKAAGMNPIDALRYE